MWKLERGQSITSGVGRAGSAGALVCDTSDHVLAVSIFLLRSPACRREWKPACFLFSATPPGGQGIAFEVHRMLLYRWF